MLQLIGLLVVVLLVWACQGGAQAQEMFAVNFGGHEVAKFDPTAEAVTPAQVSAFAGTVLDPAKASVIIVGDRSKMGDAIAAALPKAEVIPVTALDLDSPTLKAAK